MIVDYIRRAIVSASSLGHVKRSFFPPTSKPHIETCFCFLRGPTTKTHHALLCVSSSPTSPLHPPTISSVPREHFALRAFFNHLRVAHLHHIPYYLQTLIRHLPLRTQSLCNSDVMSHANQLRKQKGKSVSFEEPVSTHAGPSSSALTQAAWSSSIQAVPVPATRAGPIPSNQVTPALSAPLSIYRPASRDYPGPPSALQAAFATAPKPKSFLELIAQTEAIVGANSRGTPLPQPVSNPVDPVTAIGPAGPSWPADIITPPLEPAVPVHRSAAAIGSGHVIQPVAPTLRAVGSASTSSSGRSTPNLGSGSFASNSTRPLPSVYAGQPFGPILPVLSSSATTSSGRSTPHLGSGLYPSGSTAPGSSLYAAQHAGPTLPAVNYAATGSSGRSTPHLGTGLSASGTEAAATSLRLTQAFNPAARPYQPKPYDERGAYATEPESYNQPAGFGGHSSYQPNPYAAPYQPSPYDGQATYEQFPGPQTQPLGYGGSSAYHPGHYGEGASYGPEQAQYGQPIASTAADQPTTYDARQLYSPSSEQPGEDSGSRGSSANEPSPYDLRETYEPESNAISAATARLKKAEDDHKLSLLRLQIRRQQLQNEQQTQRLQQLQNQERERNERLQQEEERQWRILEQREARNSRRR